MGVPLKDLKSVHVTQRSSPREAPATTHDGWVPINTRYEGQEIDYVEYTSDVAVGATTEGGATTIVTSSTLLYDGRPVLIEFYAPSYSTGTNSLTIVLYQQDPPSAAASIGQLSVVTTNGTYPGSVLHRRISPSMAYHNFSVRAFVDAGVGGSVHGGAGGSGDEMPGFIRITRAKSGIE